MNKKRLITSLVMLTFALSLFVAASLAWFSVSQNAESNNVTIITDDRYITSTEITYYTYDDVYLLDSETDSIKTWDTTTSNWIAPTYESPEDSGHQF